MEDFKFTYDENLAMQEDGTEKNYIKKGGHYKGKILSAEIKRKGLGATLELEMTTDAGETTGKQFFVLVTKEGKSTDKNDNELSGRKQLSRLLWLTQVKTITDGHELNNKKIGFFGHMKNNWSEKDYKWYLNFNTLDFMDHATNQTFFEKKQNKPATRYTSNFTDESLNINPPENRPASNETQSAQIPESDLPF